MAGRGRDPVFKKPRTDQSSKAGRRAAALGRLKNQWQLRIGPIGPNEEGEWTPETEPVVTFLLKAVDGGVEHCVTTLRAHDDEDARAFVETWDFCSKKDRLVLTVEEIAHAAGIGSLRLVEVTQTALFLYGNTQTQMMMAAGLPKIVAQSIAQAKKPRGLADREWMLKAGKILPVPKGSQIAIQNVVEGRETQQITEGGHEWKYPEDRLKEIIAITNPKQLEAGKSAHDDNFHLQRHKTTVFER